MNCPCCQQPVPDGSLWWVDIPFTHSEARIITNLNAAFHLTGDQVMAGVYADRKSLSPILSRLRAKIRPHGWTVANKSENGKPGRYWLKEVA